MCVVRNDRQSLLCFYLFLLQRTGITEITNHFHMVYTGRSYAQSRQQKYENTYQIRRAKVSNTAYNLPRRTRTRRETRGIDQKKGRHIVKQNECY